MNLVKILGEGFAWTTAGSVAGKVVGFANIFIILTNLSAYEYGLTELVMSVVSTIGLFLLPGLSATVTTDLAVERARKDYGAMKTLFSEFLLMNFALGIVAWAILFFGSSIVADWSGNMLIDQFFKIVSFSFLISPFRIATAMLATVMVRYADQSFFGVTEEVAKFGLLLLFLVHYESGAAGLLWAIVLAPLLPLLLFLPRTLSAYAAFKDAMPNQRAPIWNILREHRKWGVASTYVVTISGNVRLWLVKLFLGTEAVGIVAFAQGILAHATGLANMTPLFAPMMPQIMSDQSRLRSFIRSATRYQAATSVALVLALMVVTPFFVQSLFPAYLASIPVALFALPSLVPNLLKSFHLSVYMMFKRHRERFFIEATRLVSTPIILPVAVYYFGLLGVGLEILITNIVVMLIRWRGLNEIVPGLRIAPADWFRVEDIDRRLGKAIWSRLTYKRRPSATLFED